MTSSSLYLPLQFLHINAFQTPTHQFLHIRASQVPTHFSRRKLVLLTGSGLVLSAKPASGFDFRLTEPDQTIDEARSTIIEHARSLVEVKPLIESGFWRDVQQQLRRSSSLLKQDMYTIIQTKPKSSQKELNKLYSQLFNIVSKLDYAARDEDDQRVKEYYNTIILALDDIFSRLL